MLRRLAKIYSYAMHPFLIPIYVMVVLLFCPTVYSYYPFKGKLYLLWVVTLFSLILPILTITLVKRFSRLYFRHLTRKQFYVMSILICSICYLLCAINTVFSYQPSSYGNRYRHRHLFDAQHRRWDCSLLGFFGCDSCRRIVGLGTTLYGAQPPATATHRLCGWNSHIACGDVVYLKKSVSNVDTLFLGKANHHINHAIREIVDSRVTTLDDRSESS